MTVMAGIRKPDPFAVLEEERIAAVLRRLHHEARWQTISAGRHSLRHLPAFPGGHPVPLVIDDMACRGDKSIAIEERQAAFCYLTARTSQARTIVEFGTSFGISTIWLAAALRANGGGQVVTTEIVPERARVARSNFEEAGLAELIEVRVGDALATLAADPAEIDLVLNDGSPGLALDIVKLLAPRMRPGAVVLTDDVGRSAASYRSYIAWIRDHANGFQSTLVPLKGGMEYSVRR